MHVAKNTSDQYEEELFSEDKAAASMNDRKRVFCDHCQDYVDKSTFYRHQTLYINANCSEPFDLDSSYESGSDLSGISTNDTYANDHDTGDFVEEIQEVAIDEVYSYIHVAN